LEQRVDEHQHQADDTGDQAGGQLVSTKGCRNLALGLDVEADRQGAVLELFSKSLRGFLGEATGNLRAAIGDHRIGGWRRNGLTIKHDGELVLRTLQSNQTLSGIGEDLGAFGIEFDDDNPFTGNRAVDAASKLRISVLDLIAGDFLWAKDVLDTHVRIAGDHWLGWIRSVAATVLEFGFAVVAFELLEELWGDPVGIRRVLWLALRLWQILLRSAIFLWGGCVAAGDQHRAELHVG